MRGRVSHCQAIMGYTDRTRLVYLLLYATIRCRAVVTAHVVTMAVTMPAER